MFLYDSAYIVATVARHGIVVSEGKTQVSNKLRLTQCCNRRLFLIVALVLAFFLPSQFFAQTSPASDGKFSASFLGDNPAAVYKIFEKKQGSFAKSEFETSQQFVERIRNLMSGMVLAKSKTALDQIVYTTNVFDQSYDADTETLTVTVKFSSYYGGYGSDTYKQTALVHATSMPWLTNNESFRNWKALELFSNEAKHGSAVGTTAFGGKKRYKIRSYTTFHLALPDSLIPPAQTFKIKIPVEQARIVSRNTRIALTGTTMFPFIAKEKSSDGATITDPEESHFFNYHLFMKPITLSVYDYRTGEVIGAVNLEGPPAPKPAFPSWGAPNVIRMPDGRIRLLPQGESTPLPPTPTATPAKVGVTTGLKILSRPRPGYTDTARNNNVQGTVTLRITFLASGQIGSVTPVKGLPHGLTEQAIAAAKRISFEPEKVDGISQTVTRNLDFSFSIY